MGSHICIYKAAKDAVPAERIDVVNGRVSIDRKDPTSRTIKLRDRHDVEHLFQGKDEEDARSWKSAFSQAMS
jgi:hypothetical protein